MISQFRRVEAYMARELTDEVSTPTKPSRLQKFQLTLTLLFSILNS